MSPLAFAGLALPVGLGLLAGTLGLFADPRTAVTALNRYALYLAFPALILAGLTDRAFELPGQVWAWAIPLLGMAVASGLIRVLSFRDPARAGTAVLAGTFGNVAYVGLPLCVSVLGPQALGAASLAVSLFVLGSLLLGPVLLVRWSDTEAEAPTGLILRQPLFWAPFAGLGARALPTEAVGLVHELAAPVGASAGPVALFLLGVYLWEERARVARLDLAGLGHVAAKLVLFPAVVALLVAGALALGWTDREAARIFVLLSATPTAIATFALAHELGTGAERVAQAIVGSTVLSVIWLPLAVSASGAWLR